MGISRDSDYTEPSSRTTRKPKIWPTDPFAALDQEGIGQLIQMAVEIGICGLKHGGEPNSSAVLLSGGHQLRVVLPYRVPIARLERRVDMVRWKTATCPRKTI